MQTPSGTAGSLVPLTIPAPHGSLEALIQEHDAPFAATIVCHPHPLFGGTMHNPVTYRVARRLHDAGAIVLRFNFRGVGESTGEYGNGIAEEEDVVAALDLLHDRYPTLPIWLVGYSFGARVGLSVGARDPRVSKLIGVGLALDMFDMSFLRDSEKPKVLIQGEFDQYGGRRAIEAFFADMLPPKKLLFVEGARHFFVGYYDAIESSVQEAIDFLREPQHEAGP